MQVYKSNAICDVSWVGTVGVAAFTQEQIFIFENAAAQLFSSMLEEDEYDLLSEEAILSTSVNVMNSETTVSPGTPALLKSTVAVTYLAQSEVPSMASVLQRTSSGKEMDSIIQAIRIFDPDATSLSVSFVDPADPSAEIVQILDISSSSKKQRSAADKGLIVATTFLSIMLIIVSAVLVWAAGGFQNLWTILKYGVPAPIVQFSNDVKHTVTNKFTSKDEYDDAEASANKDMSEVGILGATSQSDQENAGVEVTPHRGLYHEDSSPLSQLTNSTINTDATQHPLGIRSLRKLKRYLTPDKNNKKKNDGDNEDKPKYDIKHLSSP
jgi:hypothetical protein